MSKTRAKHGTNPLTTDLDNVLRHVQNIGLRLKLRKSIIATWRLDQEINDTEGFDWSGALDVENAETNVREHCHALQEEAIKVARQRYRDIHGIE